MFGGVPQGRVLSTHVPLHGFVDVFQYLPHGIRTAVYEDDLVTYYSDSNISAMERILLIVTKKLRNGVVKKI